ncbi:hypothetical protein [Streptomyces cyslabdanicus]|uniref:hypothetical protein n=1 Tax=Streptomyces cyslabdanicus TaxID=1470456 RepID=UPI004044A0B1
MTLPAPGAEDQWSELLIHTAAPKIGRQWWTDTGEIHEERDLKERAERGDPDRAGVSRSVADPAAAASRASGSSRVRLPDGSGAFP